MLVDSPELAYIVQMVDLGTHIVSAFDAEVNAFDRMVLEMSGLAEAQVTAAMDVLRTMDEVAAQRLVRRDERLDELEAEIQQRVLGFLARRAPVADDLRRAFGAVKIAGSLERIGDHAKRAAKTVILLQDKLPLDIPDSLFRLGKQASELLHDVMNGYAGQNADLAKAVWYQDQELDDMHSAVTRALVRHMQEQPDRTDAYADLLFVAKSMERVGDHATNIAEVIQFQLAGEWNTEGRPKGE